MRNLEKLNQCDLRSWTLKFLQFILYHYSHVILIAGHMITRLTLISCSSWLISAFPLKRFRARILCDHNFIFSICIHSPWIAASTFLHLTNRYLGLCGNHGNSANWKAENMRVRANKILQPKNSESGLPRICKS